MSRTANGDPIYTISVMFRAKQFRCSGQRSSAILGNQVSIVTTYGEFYVPMTAEVRTPTPFGTYLLTLPV